MSDPAGTPDIEDVLSSIRRLVSEEPTRRAPNEDADEGVDRLVLTPAFRVADADDSGSDPETLDNSDAQPETEASADPGDGDHAEPETTTDEPLLLGEAQSLSSSTEPVTRGHNFDDDPEFDDGKGQGDSFAELAAALSEMTVRGEQEAAEYEERPEPETDEQTNEDNEAGASDKADKGNLIEAVFNRARPHAEKPDEADAVPEAPMAVEVPHEQEDDSSGRVIEFAERSHDTVEPALPPQIDTAFEPEQDWAEPDPDDLRGPRVRSAAASLGLTQPDDAGHDSADAEEPTSAPRSSSLETRIAELEAAIAASADTWEPDGSEQDLTDETRPIALDAQVDPRDLSEALGQADDNRDEHDDEGNGDDPVSWHSGEALFHSRRADEPETPGDEDDLDAAPRLDDIPEDAGALDWEDTDRPDEDTVEFDASSIEDAETDEAVTSSDTGTAFVHRPVSDHPGSGPEAASRPAAEEQPVDAGDADEDAEPGHIGNAFADDDGLTLDEDALRELVSELVREELQGVLGERITRNVRRLVRREIQRALAMRDLQ